jgi:hypothetical protein
LFIDFYGGDYEAFRARFNSFRPKRAPNQSSVATTLDSLKAGPSTNLPAVQAQSIPALERATALAISREMDGATIR